MSKELDFENIVNAIKGDPIVRSCVTCEHYRGSWFSDVTCARELKLTYHPITGKKVLMGEVFTCMAERCMTGRLDRPENPCGPSGKHWQEKRPSFWSWSWWRN